MSLSPMRPTLVDAAEVTQDDYTIREAIEWFKKVYSTAQAVEIVAEQEGDYFDKQFGLVAERTAKDQGLPTGPLGQFIASVAVQEIAQALIDSVANE